MVISFMPMIFVVPAARRNSDTRLMGCRYQISFILHIFNQIEARRTVASIIEGI
jgi:hypothetical protein